MAQWVQVLSQAWWPEFESWILQGRRKLTSESGPLTSTHVLFGMYVPAHTHTYTPYPTLKKDLKLQEKQRTLSTEWVRPNLNT